MNESRLLVQSARTRRREAQARARRARRRRRLKTAASILAAGLVTLLVFMVSGATGPRAGSPAGRRHADPTDRRLRPRLNRPSDVYGAAAVPAWERVRIYGALPAVSALLFDVRSGKVLWARAPNRELPIASLTKMMTALVVVAHAQPQARVLITPQAIHFTGSGVGLLPLHQRVSLEALLYGLLLPSGNDAAIALAQHVAGTRPRFIAMMNARARAMGLRCTHFDTVSGIIDQGNYSCARDLAVIADAVLKQPLLARIVATGSIVLPFPIKGGKLYLYNNNPLLGIDYRGTDGVKTGFTDAAGACLVVAARRGRAWLGVVLLHSSDPSGQAQALLGDGFAALQRQPRPQRQPQRRRRPG